MIVYTIWKEFKEKIGRFQKQRENFSARVWFQFQVLLNFLKSLVAVVSGNTLYFFILGPLLPVRAHHIPHRFDLGLILDAWICLVIYGIIELGARHRRRQPRRL